MDIRNLFEVNKMNDDVMEYREKWRSDVHQVPDSKLPRRVFTYRLCGKWDLGRP
jgi:hypothetical protein